MNVLASNFSGLTWIFVAIPIVLGALALVSFIPSSRGHWSGPVLATPAVGIGLLMCGVLMFASAAVARAQFLAWVMVLGPPLLGILSIGLWSECRGRRER